MRLINRSLNLLIRIITNLNLNSLKFLDIFLLDHRRLHKTNRLRHYGDQISEILLLNLTLTHILLYVAFNARDMVILLNSAYMIHFALYVLCIMLEEHNRNVLKLNGIVYLPQLSNVLNSFQIISLLNNFIILHKVIISLLTPLNLSDQISLLHDIILNLFQIVNMLIMCKNIPMKRN